MAIAHILLDENSGFVVETPVLIPLEWRYVIRSTVALGTDWSDVVSNSFTCTLPGSSVSYDPAEPNWNTGGIATINRKACKWQNGSGYFFRRSFGVYYRPYAYWTYVHASAGTAYTFTDKNVEVDFATAFQTLRDTYDPSFYRIGAIRFTDYAGNVCDDNDLVQEGLIDLDKLNGYYVDEDAGTDELFNFETEFTYAEQTRPYGAGGSDVIINPLADYDYRGVSNDEAGENFAQTVKDMGINQCASNGRNVCMYMKVWVKMIVGFNGAVPGDTTLFDEETKDDPVDWSSLGGTSGSSGIGSGDDGMNTFYSNYGNSNIPFDSIYLTGSNFNSFVSAGGGIVTESGVFAQSSSLFIESVRVDIEGSSATIIEDVKFDETPSLTLGEKLYIYLFDDDNQEMPVFCGFITSRKRRLTGKRQEMVYECRDLLYFLDQFYTPSHYIYRPPSYEGTGVTKTYDRVLKEILNVAGIPDAVVDVPSYNAPPMTWIYQPLRNVLEWAVKFFGNYVYYVDRHGRLRIRSVTSGSTVKSYAVPSEGDSLTDSHVVEQFEPITDFSRSRSRIVLTGDFEITEKMITSYFTRGGELHPNDNDNQTGIFWFKDTIDDDPYDDDDGEEHKFYYFMFKPGETLNPKLLTDENTSCRVTILNYTDQDGNKEDKVMSPRVFKTDPGDSEIYVEGGEFKQSRKIEVIYAVRSDSPIQVSADTSYFGGTEVVRRPEFKKASSMKGEIDDTPLMRSYLTKLKEFYRPIYGGTMEIDGLDLDIQLLDKVSVTGTSLPSSESTGLAVYSITWNCIERKTYVNLSSKAYLDLPFFDPMRERSRQNNEMLAKMGLLEEKELYFRV